MKKIHLITSMFVLNTRRICSQGKSKTLILLTLVTHSPTVCFLSFLCVLLAVLLHRSTRSFHFASNLWYDIVHQGDNNTQEYRVYLHKDSNNKEQLSYWHDVGLVHGIEPNETSIENITIGATFNFVNEIPRGTTAKLEVATKEINNPIKQDIKKGKLRHYHTPSLVNYGMLPQTWENPFHKDKKTGYKGDNDPVDVCEVGSRIAAVGEIYSVKVLGALG